MPKNSLLYPVLPLLGFTMLQGAETVIVTTAITLSGGHHGDVSLLLDRTSSIPTIGGFLAKDLDHPGMPMYWLKQSCSNLNRFSPHSCLRLIRQFPLLVPAFPFLLL